MNNIINIRLGHYVLAADEDAATTLRKYSEALKQRYQKEESATEIVGDIEERIGELLQQKQHENARNFTTLKDAEEVLAQMGPIPSNEAGEQAKSFTGQPMNEPLKKRLFRNPDRRILGGVCGGIAAYFDIDVVFIRLIWLVFFFVFGIGFPAYIICWIVIPEANTTAEKLMMMGQSPTLQNIEENVKAEFKKVNKNTSKSGWTRFGDFLNNLIRLIGTIIVGILRVFLIVFTAIMLVILIGLLATFTTNAFYVHTYHTHITGQDGLNTILTLAGNPFWLKLGAAVLIILLIFILVTTVFANQRARERMRLPRRYATLFMIVLFFVLFISCIQGVLNISSHTENDGSTEIIHTKSDTLYIESIPPFADGYGFYTLNTFADILESEDSNFRIEQKNLSWGNSHSQAFAKASAMPKLFNINGNHLQLIEANKVSSLTDKGAGWARFIVYVPKGKTIKTGNRFFNESNYHDWLAGNQIYGIDSAGFAYPSDKNSIKIPLGSSLRNIEVSGRFQVQVIPSNQNSLELISGPILHHRNWIDRDDDQLSIESSGRFFSEQPSVIRIYTKNASGFRISGVTELLIRGLKAKDIELQCNGASKIRGKLNASNARFEVTGVSEIMLEGSAERMELEAHGASSFQGSKFKTTISEVELSGTSSSTIWATDDLQANCSGASKLNIKDRPHTFNISTSGVSSYQYVN